MRINHNIAALNTYRQLGNNTTATGKALEKLSSGLRINRAGDDAAGLAISEKMRSQIRGLEQATRNSQDAISMIQTTEGALNETHSILQRMRELAVQASNDTNTGDDRAEIQKEINQLTSEVNRIGNTTEFNTKKLLNGDLEFVAATKGSTKASLALSASTVITNTDTAGSVTGGAYGAAGTRNPKASAATATGTVAANATAIATDNNELTLKVDGTEYNIIFTAGTAAGSAALSDINAQLASAGATAEFDASNKLVIKSNTLGSGGSVEILGGNFAASFLYDSSTETLSDVVHTEGKDVNDVWMHGATAGEVTGSVSLTNTGLTGTPITIAAGANELTVTIDGTQQTINLTVGDTYDGTAGQDVATLLSDLNTALGGTGTFSIDSGNKLVLTSASTGTTSNVSIDGGGLANVLFGSAASRTTQAGLTANNSFDLDVDGVTKTITLANKVYQNLDDFVTSNAAAFTAAGVTAASDGGVLKLTSNATGVASAVTNIEDTDATRQLGLVQSDGTALAAGNFIAGANGNTTLALTVDGENVNAVIQQGTYTDRSLLASAVQSAINNATTTAADVVVSVNENNELVITSGKEGSTSGITIGTHASKDAAGILGLTTNTATAGTDKANAEVSFQIGANQNQSMSLSIADMRAAALGLTGTGTAFSASNNVTNGTNNSDVEKALDVTTAENAANAITVIDGAIKSVSSERSRLGASQNRLEHTINNLGASSENLTAAESRIRDVDMAKEMMEFTKNNILSQAAQAMLAQANQQPQGVLQLLR
ncbi:flagellin [Paenibacillus oryzisoli]|uniref:flagellin N-terminal helical domain-containing protein n=1 Tax=Paenibacillus oryzisoli TaxID=1850517 RepID=UPI003D297175